MEKKQVIRAIQESIELYEKNLANKKVLIIFEINNEFQKLEIVFKRNNFLHLTGLNIKNMKMNSLSFYKKALRHRLSLNDFEVNSDGTTKLKLEILNQVSSINKFINMVGNYAATRKFLIADKVIGNLNICLCLKKIDNINYVPVSALRENIKRITDKQYKIICIATKPIKEKAYSKITYSTKEFLELNPLEKLNSSFKTID